MHKGQRRRRPKMARDIRLERLLVTLESRLKDLQIAVQDIKSMAQRLEKASIYSGRFGYNRFN